MRTKLTTLLTVIGAVTVLVLAANTVALATTGKALIAGKTNTTSKITTIKRTAAGVPLKITSTSTKSAPLAVNGKGKVTNLNADTIDSLSSSSLITKPYVITRVVNSRTGTLVVSAPASLPTGYYSLSYSVTLTTATGNGDPDIGGIRCRAPQPNPGSSTTFLGESLVPAPTGNTIASVSGSAVVRKTTAQTKIGIECAIFNSGASYTTFGQQPVQLVLTRLNGIVPSN
ncbi:MAG: hypothetical protein JWQ74_3235 [Marmoricola sp.]|nr:hypothetical protein [Marmoricola sp.]